MNSALIEPLEARIAPATITIAPASVLEGDANTTTKLIFIVTLSEASQEQITVDFATEDGTAKYFETQVADYAAKTGTVTFAPGETTKTIEITVFGDDDGEEDETMFVRLSNPTGGATIETDVATGTILNDGVHLVGLTSFLEGDETHFVTYTILRETLTATGNLTVKVKTIDGTATVADNDYTAADASITLGDNQRTATFTIEIIGDTKGEDDETFLIALSDENDVPFGAPTTITILNDGLHILSASTLEGDFGLKGLDFKVIRETVDLGPATVRYTTVDGTATLSDKDYQLATGTLSFAQGEKEKTITVNIIGDLIGEDDETFFVKLYDAVGTTITHGEATGTILNDAKLMVLPASSLEGDGIDADQDGIFEDQRYLDFVVTLVEGYGQVTVDYATQDGSEEGFNALAGSDYDATSGTLTFQSGETSKTVQVRIIGDLVGENDEKLLLTLFNPSPGAIIETASAEGTILNDVKFSFSPGPGQTSTADPFKEGDFGLSYMDFVIQASEAAPSGSKVKYATSDISPASGTPAANIALAGEDYIATSGTLTFFGEGSNILTQTVKVPIKGDYKFESNEKFLMSLSSAGTSHAPLPSSLEATITSDDELIINDVRIVEGDSGVKKAVFTVTLKDAVPNGKQFRVHYTTVDGTATGIAAAGAGVGDYKITSGTLKIAAGERTGTIEVEVFGDLDYEEASEFFKVSLDNARLLSAGVADNSEEGAQSLEIGIREGTATIVESADAPPSISISDSRFLEGSGGGKKQVQFTLTLSVPSFCDVKVKLSSILGTGPGAAGPDDFTQFEDKVVIIPAGQTTATFFVEVEQDDIDELDETFFVKIKEAITVPPQGSNVPSVSLPKARDTAVGTIVNDEVSVTVDPVTITEGDTGTKEMIFLVKLSAAATHDVIIHYTLEDLTARLGQDYMDGSQTPGTVVIKAGTTQAEIKILVIGDTVNEGGLQAEPDTNTEQFKLKLTSATNAKLGEDGTAPLTVIGTIVDDDPFPTVEIVNEMPNGQVIEGGKAIFKVKLDRASDHDIEIPYSIVNGTAVGGSDFTVGSNLKVVIRAGQTEAIITVETLDDTLIEANETFSVKLGTIGEKDAVLKTPTSGEAIATIKDNEAKPTLSIGNVVVVEGGPGANKKAIFTVKLSAVSTETIQVNYHTIDGTAVSFGADADYTATSGTLTIEAGQTEGIIEVPIIGDSIVEGDETFFVRLTNPAGATIAIGQAMGTILTDETQFRVLFKNADGSFSETLQVTEGDKGTTQKIQFKIVREGDLTKDSSVRFMTVGAGHGVGDLFRDATSEGPRADFGYRSEVVYFKNGSTESGLYDIIINGDDYYEGTEEFVVRLTEALNGSPAEANPKMGTVQILDNEAVPTITFEKSLVEVKEGGKILQSNGTYVPQKTAMTFKIKLSHVDETGTVSMQVLAEAMEAAGLTKAMASGDKQDYVLPANVTSISFAPGETEKTYTITVLGDWRDEDDESILLTLSGLQGGSAKFSDGTNVAPASISAIGKILDDDAPAVVYISNLVKQQVDSSGNPVFDSKNNPVYIGTTYTEADGNGTGKFFLVSLSGETDKVVTVKYYTVNGTAIAGEDFIGISEADAITITFNPSASNTTAPITQKIYISTINDDVVEGNEDFLVRLKGLTNATAGGDLRGRATIEDNDTPIVSIEDLEIVETGSIAGILKAKFIVRLAAPAERDVVVNFATEDGTAKSSGVFADYIAKQGIVTFKPGEVVKEIEIDIIDDDYLEGYAIKNSNNEWELVQNETFKVKLSGTGVTFARATATGTILNGPEDTVIGIGVSDVQLAEDQTEVVNGKTVDLPARFSVELSIPSLTNTTVNASTRSGTATKGVDFEDKSAAVTINAGATTATFAVDVFNDQEFENTEYFFADLSNTPAGVQVVKSGRATIYNDDIRQIDARTVQWIDVDGDLVTLKVSKGTLDRNNFIWLRDSSGAIYISPVGGLVLQGLDLSVGNEFQNANITITAERQPGFNGDPNGILGDGRVNIGFIKAGDLDPAGVSSYGVDLGIVKIDGDLGFINAGDRYLDTPAIRKLQVFSMGVHAEELGLITRDSEGNVTGASIQSNFQGPVGTIDVRTDVSSSIRVTGGQFADIQSIKIGGALRGTDVPQSGTIIFSGTLQKATIGEIIGGTGSLSGRIEGDASVVGNIGTIVVKGDLKGLGGGSGAIAASSIQKVSVGQVLGGVGNDSGQIRAGLLYNVVVKGDVIGGDGAQSGAILTDRAFGAKTGVGAGTVKIGGRLIGGIGAGSGMLSSHGGFVGITVGGKLPAGEEPGITAAIVGGEGEKSGSIQSGGEIRSLKIGGTWKVKEGNAPAVVQSTEVSLQGGLGEGSGSINAGGIRTAQLTGAIVGGEGQISGKLYSAGAIGTLKVTGFNFPDDDSGNKVSLKGGDGVGSGVIHAQGSIGKVTLGGEVQGGSATETGVVAAGSIGSLNIDGDLIGGAGDTSGAIHVTGAIRSLTVGDVLGGSAANSGAINAGSIGSVRILGNLVGGDASTTGVIQVGGAINSLVVGHVLGGSASATGAIAAGSIGSARILGNLAGSNVSTTGVIKVAGAIKSLFIGGDLKGGDSKAQNEAQSVEATVESGAITAGKIGSLRISGDVTAGEDLGAGLTASGSIGAQGPIGTLEIGGSILGRQNVPVKILAFGDTKAAAIGKLLVGGRQGSDRVEYAEITAGVSIYSTQQGYFPVNADAKIGLVRIDGNVKGLNITAGVNTGADGKFATADDQVLSHPIAEINNPKVYSSIAQVIINGTIEAVPGESEGETLPFGIVAQYIGKVSYKDGNVLKNVALQKGAGNDKSPGLEIKPGGEDTGFRVIEVPIG